MADWRSFLRAALLYAFVVVLGVEALVARHAGEVAGGAARSLMVRLLLLGHQWFLHRCVGIRTPNTRLLCGTVAFLALMLISEALIRLIRAL